jgi:hypothetical protein
MKTTLELPDTLFRQAKSAAAQRGIPFRELVAEALAEKLLIRSADARPWMTSFGKLKALHKESARIDRIVNEEFDQVEPEDRQ